MENNRYNNSKVYKLIDEINDYFYIGSTCDKLSKRLSWHKTSARHHPERKVYKYFNSINWNNVKIVLIEEHYLENKVQLLREEDKLICYYKNDTKCLNSFRAIWEDKIAQKERNNNLTKQWMFKTKKHVKTKGKEYRENNTDKLKQTAKYYYEVNKK